MALRIDEAFDGPAGVALDTTNTTATQFTGTGTSTFDVAHVAAGSTSARFGNAAQLRFAEWSLTSVTTGFFSVYFTPQTIPTVDVIFMRVGTAPFSPAFTVVLRNTTGFLKLGNSTNVALGGFTTDSAVPNQLNRIDVSYNAGNVKMEFYPGDAQANNPVGTATAGNTRAGATVVTSYSFRAVGAGNSTLVMNVDAFREDDTALPGPAVAPSVAVGAVSFGAAGDLAVGASPVGVSVAAAMGGPARLVAGAVTTAGPVTYLAGAAFNGPADLVAAGNAGAGPVTYLAGAALNGPGGLTSGAGRVTAATAALRGPGQLTATAGGPVSASQVLYLRSGSTLIPVRLGMRTGATVTYLSP